MILAIVKSNYVQIKSGIAIFIVFSILLGIIYPLTITLIAQLFFPEKANGSLIYIDNKIVGSKLIGQPFSDIKYFWGRPSSTPLFPYNSADSRGSNLAPGNPKYLELVGERAALLRKMDPMKKKLIPVELVTASASGLDPDISPLAALYQVPRIAKARHRSEEEISKLVNDHIQFRTFGFLGEPRVNVLELNLALNAKE